MSSAKKEELLHFHAAAVPLRDSSDSIPFQCGNGLVRIAYGAEIIRPKAPVYDQSSVGLRLVGSASTGAFL